MQVGSCIHFSKVVIGKNVNILSCMNFEHDILRCVLVIFFFGRDWKQTANWYIWRSKYGTNMGILSEIENGIFGLSLNIYLVWIYLFVWLKKTRVFWWMGFKFLVVYKAGVQTKHCWNFRRILVPIPVYNMVWSW